MYLLASQGTFEISGKCLFVTVDAALFVPLSNAKAWSLDKHTFLNTGELVISGIFLTVCPNLEMMLIEVQYIAILLVIYVFWLCGVIE